MRDRFIFLRSLLALLCALLLALALVHKQTLISLHQEQTTNRYLRQSLSQRTSEASLLLDRERQEQKNREAIEGWGTKRVSESSAVVIPAIAQLAGVRVGFDSVERLEHLFGPGYAFTGGHPNGAREWRSRQTGWYINADGFDYNKRGERVLDTVSIGITGIIGGKTAPSVFAPRQRLLFLGGITLGMTREQVRSALENRLPPPRVNGDSWVWEAKGFSPPNPNNNGESKRDWCAILTFATGRLAEITVDAG